MADGSATLTGIVTDQAGDPLSGVYVTIPGCDEFAITDGDGCYTLYDPPHRRYTVKYFQEWYKAAYRLVILRAGETTTVDVVLADV